MPDNDTLSKLMKPFFTKGVNSDKIVAGNVTISDNIKMLFADIVKELIIF